MAETHSERGGEGGVGPSHSKTDGDLLSVMAQMLADLKDNVNGLQSNFNGLQSDMNGVRSDMNGVQSDVKASEICMQTLHNTLFEEVNALKESRSSRPPTPRGGPMPNEVPKEYNGGEGYEGEYVRNMGDNGECGHFSMENGMHGRFGGGNRMNGRGGRENRPWRVEPYGERFPRGDTMKKS
ncbi:hypothetical protein AAHA92_29301 [Salvia divinorum]|uniref:Uncharacterized protein n=1 Tax=Salvia divinorum TaxID=28513 RepID=A0ABD1G0W0_SALDI